MKQWITTVIIGSVLLAIASFLLGPRFSTGEVIGLYLIVVAAKV